MAERDLDLAASQHQTQDGAVAGAPPMSVGDLAISGVVLDAVQLLTALRMGLPRACGIASISNGAYYAVLLVPPTPAPAAPLPGAGSP